MKKYLLSLSLLAAFSLPALAPAKTTRIFTVFTTAGCGCTGSGGAPLLFTTHADVIAQLERECRGVAFIARNVTENAPVATILETAFRELENAKNSYDGVLIIGNMHRDFRLAFTGLPTIVVYNLFEFMSGIPYHFLSTGRADRESLLVGGTDYGLPRILTAQLDRRNLSSPTATQAMFKDLVSKIKLIQAINELKGMRILMVKGPNETVAGVNYRGDKHQAFPPDHNERSLKAGRDLFGVEFAVVEIAEFYATYQKIDVRKAESLADQWIRGAREVTASRSEIVKTARGYLAIDSLRTKYQCDAVSTHVRSVAAGGKLEHRYNPGVGFELGFKTRGIQAVCQNYPDLLIGQILGHLMTGRPSMLGDMIYDVFNSAAIALHCGIPINPYGGEQRIPYVITPHAESPVRNFPEKPGSSTGMRAEWPEGESVTFWDLHSHTREIRLNTGVIVDGRRIYSGAEDIANVMCTAKVIAQVRDASKLRDHYRPDRYGIHSNVTLGDLRQPLRDLATLLGFKAIETDR